MDSASATLGGRRVAILSHSHPSLTKGGGEIAAHTLFLGLRAAGVDAILIAMCDEEALDTIVLGPDEHALSYRAGFYDHFYHVAVAGVRRAFVDLLRRERIDLLNAHHFLHVGIDAFTEVAEAGVPIVFTIHEFLAICHNHGQMITRGTQILCDGPSPTACRACYPEHSRQQFALRQRHIEEALRSVAAFVSPSRFLADRMVANGLPAARMNLIENAIAQPEAAPPSAPRSARRAWTFGFFGQINPFKGMDVLLDACAILAREPEMAVRIRIRIHGNFVGQSDAFIARFEAAVKEYPFLSYLGPYDNRVVGGLMAACDYVVAPSTWWENSPVVIQEAFHARRPVICTGIGGMAEKVIDGVSGLHFARNDPADLADRIVEAADADLHRRLQAALPEARTPEQMTADYLAVFDEILSAPPVALAS